jgi:hypothetical protein
VLTNCEGAPSRIRVGLRENFTAGPVTRTMDPSSDVSRLLMHMFDLAPSSRTGVSNSSGNQRGWIDTGSGFICNFTDLE